MKRIVICCDGTWNSPDQDADGKPCPTNVTKIAARIEGPTSGNVEQRVYYDTGVGAMARGLGYLLGGAIGTGLDGKLVKAYRHLAAIYRPGDQIFLFGFSRGAFTVRSLAGMVVSSGIVRPEHEAAIGDAFKLYRSRSDATRPRGTEATLFRCSFAWEDRTPIHFIGVWDTVGSLGNPFRPKFLSGRGVPAFLQPRNQFHDVDLSSTVRHAYHAVAIDERRRNFRPTLWVQTPSGAAAGQTLVQEWFPGSHSDVGGGSGAAGLSDAALEWMIGHARACGLGVAPPGPADARAELRASPEPVRTPLTDPYRGGWKLLGAYKRRFRDPDVIREARRAAGRAPDAVDPKLETNEALAAATLARLAGNSSYRPDNFGR